MEKIELVDMINDLYKNEWSDFQNHFCPTMKLMTKEKINSKYRRKYEDPQTPYHRIIACEHIDEATKSALVKKHDLLNPFELKRVIHVKLGNIFEHVIVTNNVRQRI
ncbi:MAG: hypothetical protein Q8K36_02770 [Alphaproteobacteria bacterium]|nr:hypothetical protein [Alphaproteobacteria bacterium]